MAFIEKTYQSNSIKLRDSKGTRLKTIEFNSSSLFYSSKHKLLIAAGIANEIALHTIDIDDLKRDDSFKVTTEAPIKAIDILDNGLLVTLSEKNVSLWLYEANEKELILVQKLDCPFEGDKFTLLQALPGDKFACGLASSNICIYNESLEQIKVIKKAHEKSISCLKYALIGDGLISLSNDEKLVKLWNYTDESCLKEFPLKAGSNASFLVMVDKRHFGLVRCCLTGNEIDIYDALEIKLLKKVNGKDLKMNFFKGLEFVNDFCYIYDYNSFNVLKFD